MTDGDRDKIEVPSDPGPEPLLPGKYGRSVVVGSLQAFDAPSRPHPADEPTVRNDLMTVVFVLLLTCGPWAVIGGGVYGLGLLVGWW